MMSKTRLISLLCFITLLSLPVFTNVQQSTRSTLDEKLDREGCVTDQQSKVIICKYDYSADGKKIEAFTIRPLAAGKYPGLLLLSGMEGAKTLITFGSILAERGFACLAISELGYGKSEGKPDFMGPNSIAAFAAGFKRFKREAFVDAGRIGVFGYSRGGMAASLLSIKLGKELKAAVFGAGVYDLKRAYDETKFDGIRQNIKAEAGLTDKALKERSSIRRVGKLRAAVLIIHGQNDENVPTNQALLLRDRLRELKKDYEIIILSDHKHGQFKGNFISPVIDFLNRRLKGVPGGEGMPKTTPHNKAMQPSAGSAVLIRFFDGRSRAG